MKDKRLLVVSWFLCDVETSCTSHTHTRTSFVFWRAGRRGQSTVKTTLSMTSHTNLPRTCKIPASNETVQLQRFCCCKFFAWQKSVRGGRFLPQIPFYFLLLLSTQFHWHAGHKCMETAVFCRRRSSPFVILKRRVLSVVATEFSTKSTDSGFHDNRSKQQWFGPCHEECGQQYNCGS